MRYDNFKLAFRSIATLIFVLIGFVSGPTIVSAASFRAGDLIKASQPSVYYLGIDGKRYVFPNERTFLTWYGGFDGVKTLTDGELSTIPLGGNATYRPGLRMVKIQTDPKVYAVDRGGRLRWVVGEAVAKALYGADWNKKIDDVPDAFFVNYAVGSPVTATADFDPASLLASIRTIGENQASVIAPNADRSSAITSDSDYLIVTGDALFASALDLKTHREGFGHRVSVVASSAAGATADGIDAWIERFRVQNPRLRYVALLGDVDQVPSFRVTLPVGGTQAWSDLNYALTGSSSSVRYLPELLLGRIPARTSAEAATFLRKVSAFEKYFAARKKTVFFGKTPELSYAQDRDAALSENAGYATQILNDPTADVLYGALAGADPSLVAYYGHGSWYANGALDQDSLARLANTDSPFLYLSGGCGFGDRSDAHRALSEALLFEEEGAAASLGASQNGGYGYDYVFMVGLLNTIATRETLGELYLTALTAEDQAAHASASNLANSLSPWDFAERMSIIGDPGLRLK